MLAHANVAPTNEDWQAYLGLLESALPGRALRILVLTDDAGPTVAQRERMNQLFTRTRSSSAKTAVLSGGKLTRGIVTVLSWFNAAIRAFQPRELDEALAYLDIGSEQRAEIDQAIVELRLVVADVSSEAREAASTGGLDARVAAMTPLVALKAKAEQALG